MCDKVFHGLSHQSQYGRMLQRWGRCNEKMRPCVSLNLTLSVSVSLDGFGKYAFWFDTFNLHKHTQQWRKLPTFHSHILPTCKPPPPRTFTRAHALLRDGRCRGSPDAVEHDDVLCARWGGVRALARGLCARFSERLKVSTEKWLE